MSFPWSCSYHPTLYHLIQLAFTSEYMTYPVFHPSPDQIQKTSFSCTNCSTTSFAFMCLLLLISLQSSGIFFLICPGFSCIESHTSYYSFNDSFPHVFIQTFA